MERKCVKTLTSVILAFVAFVAGILPCTSVAAQSSEPKIVVVTPPRPLPDRIDFVRKTRTQWFNDSILKVNSIVLTVYVDDGRQTTLRVNLNGSGQAAAAVALESVVSRTEKFLAEESSRLSTNNILSAQLTGDRSYPSGAPIVLYVRETANFSLLQDGGRLKIPQEISAQLKAVFNSEEMSTLLIEIPGVTRFGLYRKVEVPPHVDIPDFDFNLSFYSGYSPTRVTVSTSRNLVQLPATDDAIEALQNAPFVGIYGDSGQLNRYRGDTGERVPLLPLRRTWTGFNESGDLETGVKTEPYALLRVEWSSDLRTWFPLEGNFKTSNIGDAYVAIPQQGDQLFLRVELAPQ